MNFKKKKTFASPECWKKVFFADNLLPLPHKYQMAAPLEKTSYVYIPLIISYITFSLFSKVTILCRTFFYQLLTRNKLFFDKISEAN